MKTILEMGRSAREASRFLMNASTNRKNEFLLKLADVLDANRAAILAAKVVLPLFLDVRMFLGQVQFPHLLCNAGFPLV